MGYHLENIDADCPVYYYEVIDSTNTQAKRLALQGAECFLVLAETQTGGRGRRGRCWESPEGTSISMSLLLRPDILTDRASMLTLVMGLSVVEALQQELGVHTAIKWPNDVVLNKKKLVGILTEMGLKGMAIDYIVIGVGINVSVVDFPKELEDKATSLQLECGYTVEREQLITAVLRCFDKNYQEFLKTQDLTGLRTRYESVMANQNQMVKVLELGHEYEGKAIGINNRGELLVEREDGSVEAVYAGEVSVRGLYSYV